MIFTIELDGIVVRYRLQKSGSWRALRDDLQLSGDDYTTMDPESVDSLTPKGTTLELEGTHYKVNPSEATLTDAVLGSASTCFRTVFPRVPSVDQLRQTIAAGDDSHMNVHVLNIDGLFELRQRPPFDITRNDPSVVVRHETFAAGNGYVGPQAARSRQLINDLYDSSIEAWLEHLRTGETQEFSDLPSEMSRQQVLAALETLRQDWRPQY